MSIELKSRPKEIKEVDKTYPKHAQLAKLFTLWYKGIMEQLYKNPRGEWNISEWKNGELSVTKEDGHTYTKYENGSVGHINCRCFFAPKTPKKN